MAIHVEIVSRSRHDQVMTFGGTKMPSTGHIRDGNAAPPVRKISKFLLVFLMKVIDIIDIYWHQMCHSDLKFSVT